MVVTEAVKFPRLGLVEKVTVSNVAVAVVTVPTAPLLNATVLLAAVVSKPVPAIVIVDKFNVWIAELLVIVGTIKAT